jgi:chromosomal replication initiation ATPase DnaA
VTAQLPLSLGHRPAHGDSDFLVAPCNQDAVAWLDRWPEWPGPALAIHGPARCGKTHLAHVWQARSGAKLITPGHLTTHALPDTLNGVTACIIDDVNDGIDERALLHLHNLLSERSGHLLLTSREPPARWPLTIADLRSRMNAASAVRVGRPDDALIGAVLIKLFADRQLRVGSDVIGFLLARIERSFAAAHRAVAMLDEMALASHRRITVPLARELVEHLETEGE